MKRLLILILVFGIFPKVISQTSHIQIVAEPGISIYIDNQLKGITSSEYGGMIIQNISSGQHLIKVVKEGYIPKEETIIIKAGEVFTYQVGQNFVPSIKISQEGNKENQSISIKKGNLKLQSLPIGINISIQSLGINTAKTQDIWLAEQIPEGTYTITFLWNGKELSDAFEIKDNMITSALVNMIDGKVENKKQVPINIPNDKEQVLKNIPDDYYYPAETVDIKATFLGRDFDYFENHLRMTHPRIVRHFFICMFGIDKYGDVKWCNVSLNGWNPTPEQSLRGNPLEEELKKIILRSKWSPAIKDGKVVPSQYSSLSFRF